MAVVFGVAAQWHFPLLVCRALSTAPAVWWGLRCALTFLGELILGDQGTARSVGWDAEKRFRITEVFLAILWVRYGSKTQLDEFDDSTRPLRCESLINLFIATLVFCVGISIIFLYGLPYVKMVPCSVPET